MQSAVCFGRIEVEVRFDSEELLQQPAEGVDVVLCGGFNAEH